MARGYSSNSDVDDYEAAVSALKTELLRAEDIILRETTNAKELALAKEKGRTQLEPLVRKLKALNASSEVNDIRGLVNVSYVLDQADTAVRNAKAALDSGHIITMSSSISEANRCVVQAEKEIANAKQQKMDEDTARQDARHLLEPATKRMAGMHAMVAVTGKVVGNVAGGGGVLVVVVVVCWWCAAWCAAWCGLVD